MVVASCRGDDAEACRLCCAGESDAVRHDLVDAESERRGEVDRVGGAQWCLRARCEQVPARDVDEDDRVEHGGDGGCADQCWVPPGCAVRFGVQSPDAGGGCSRASTEDALR